MASSRWHRVQAVADAILESVLPRTADDELPRTPAGIVASVSDRADSLMGLAAAGCLPSAASDPFGMRRTCVGLLQTLLGNEQRASVRRLLELARAQQSIECGEGVLAAVEDFAAKRLEQLLLDRGVAPLATLPTCAAGVGGGGHARSTRQGPKHAKPPALT